MKKIGRLILSFLTSVIGMAALSSCGLIENGDINDYVGEYVSGTGYERVKHYYWGNTTVKSERQIMSSGCTILIYPNKKVLFQYPNYGDIREGKVKVYKDYVTFADLPIDSSYQFKLKDNHSLSYSYYEDKHGLDYDFVTRDAYLEYHGPIDESKSLITEDNGFIHIERKQESYEVLDENYVFKGFYGHYAITGQDAEGNPIDISNAAVQWSSSDTSIAKVDYQGAVEAVSAGTFTLRARYGRYYDQIEINTAIVATKFEMTDLADEYRAGSSYSIPISFTPFNATVQFTSNDSSIVKISDDHKTFRVLRGGDATITAEAFTHFSGQKTSHAINIHAVEELAPRFEHGNRTMTSATISVAKNKYSQIEPEKLDIHAYSSTGTDITELIEIESGDYNLFSEGTYHVVLRVTDINNRTARFYLTLEVTEFETVKTDSMFVVDGIVEVSHSITPVSIQYSLAIKQIVFTMDIKLAERFDAADLDVRWLIYFKIKRWDDNHYVDYSENPIVIEDYHFVKDGPTTLHMEYTYTNANALDPRTLTDQGVYASGSGYYYEYNYY